MAVLGLKLQPTSQGLEAYQALAFSVGQVPSAAWVDEAGASARVSPSKPQAVESRREVMDQGSLKGGNGDPRAPHGTWVFA